MLEDRLEVRFVAKVKRGDLPRLALEVQQPVRRRFQQIVRVGTLPVDTVERRAVEGRA